MQAHLPTSIGFLSAEAIGGVVFPQTTPTPFVPLEKPMEAGRCAYIIAQLQLEHW